MGLIILILLAAKHVAPQVGTWLGAQTQTLRTASAQQQAYAEAMGGFEAYASQRRLEAEAATKDLGDRGEAALRARREAIELGLGHQRAAQLSGPDLALAAARGDSEAVLSHYRSKAEAALLENERQQIDAILSARAARREGLRLGALRRASVAEAQASYRQWQAAEQRARALDARFLAGPRNEFCRLSPLNIGCDNYRALVAARRAADAAAARNRQARSRIAAIDAAEQGRKTAAAVVAEAGSLLAQQQTALAADAARVEDTARASWLVRVQRAVSAVLPTALAILAVATIAPVVVKALLFFVVAPLAARRPPVRLIPDDLGQVRTVAGSAVSQRVAIAPGQELLVAPQALQSTPHHAAKRTRWLLSWRIPFSSLASGLVGLTEIRVARSDSVLVSATGGPEAEIVLIELGEGSAMVLRPRALRGVLQDGATPMQITRRWRFGLSAWLTLQFRYLVFHGPCTFIIQGARGARLEPAGAGRGINQAATIGFSAGLNYGVSRSETFVAYLLGRQALFNDSFEGESGAHLHEEMLVPGRKGELWSRGLQGLGDAALKVIGL